MKINWCCDTLIRGSNISGDWLLLDILNCCWCFLHSLYRMCVCFFFVLRFFVLCCWFLCVFIFHIGQFLPGIGLVFALAQEERIMCVCVYSTNHLTWVWCWIRCLPWYQEATSNSQHNSSNSDCWPHLWILLKKKIDKTNWRISIWMIRGTAVAKYYFLENYWKRAILLNRESQNEIIDAKTPIGNKIYSRGVIGHFTMTQK